MSIAYKKGYKYQLHEDRSCDSGIEGYQFSNSFVQICPDGRLYVDAGYAWDGPSGPTIDTKSFMRGSLFHDALYQLMREGALPTSLRDDADRLIQKHCIQDGMWRWRAWTVYTALKWFGGKNVLASRRKPIQRAP